MFYELQPQAQKDNYRKMLSIVGALTQLFSESDCPYLAYRAHENIFCKIIPQLVQKNNAAQKFSLLP